MNKKPPVTRNFVHKASVEINKPKVFRDKKKDYARKQKYEGFELEHPVHRPYSRTSNKNKNIEDEYFDADDYEDLCEEADEQQDEAEGED